MRRDEIVDAARTMLGLRYRHMGSDPARLRDAPLWGIDCPNHVYRTAELVGVALGPPPADYGPRPIDEKVLTTELVKRLGASSDPRQAQPGDVVLLSYPGWPWHVGIVGQARDGRLTVIHASLIRRKVVEESLFGGKATPLRVWSLPGVEP